MSIPQPQKDEQGKIVGDFYPLQRAEILALRKNKLINNAAYVHLALRFENPFCDRPIEILPKEFALRWSIPESSVYEAIAKLKEAGAIEIKYGKVIIQWINSQENENIDSQQNNLSGNPESAQPIRIDSGFSETSLDSQKEFRNPRNNSEDPEKGIYKDRARSSDYSDLNQTDQIGNEPPPPAEIPIEVEVVATEEEKHEIPLSQESKDLVPTRELQETHEDNSSAAAANVKFLEEIERIAYDWKKRPWMASATKFKPDMIKAVWQCNPTYYSIRGTQTPNQQHIVKALKLRDQQLQSLDELAINAYHELNRWWNTAKALANPHVQHAFVAAANQSKEQVEELERQRRIQEKMKLIEDL